MIRSLHIQNFQSHVDSTVDLSPHFTVFVGENDHGKSVIFRAFTKVIRNIPVGEGFVHNGKDELKLTLTTDKGTVIRSENPKKGTPGNIYIANEVKFAGFGRVIPLEVRPVLEVSNPVMFGDVELDINFGHQHDGLFLIGDTPGTRGKVLGKIAGIDLVSRKRQVNTARAQANERELKRLEGDVTGREVDLAKFATVDQWLEWVQSTQMFVTMLKLSSDRLDTLKSRHDKVQSLYSRWGELTGVVTRLSPASLLSVQPLVARVQLLDALRRCQVRGEGHTSKYNALAGSLARVPVLPDVTRVQLQSQRLHSLRVLATRLKAIRARQEYVESVLGPLLAAQPTVSAVENTRLSVQKLSTLTSLSSKWRGLRGKKFSCDSELSILSTESQQVELELQELKQKLGVCPICGEPFKGVHLHA